MSKRQRFVGVEVGFAKNGGHVDDIADGVDIVATFAFEAGSSGPAFVEVDIARVVVDDFWFDSSVATDDGADIAPTFVAKARALVARDFERFEANIAAVRPIADEPNARVEAWANARPWLVGPDRRAEAFVDGLAVDARAVAVEGLGALRRLAARLVESVDAFAVSTRVDDGLAIGSIDARRCGVGGDPTLGRPVFVARPTDDIDPFGFERADIAPFGFAVAEAIFASSFGPRAFEFADDIGDAIARVFDSGWLAVDFESVDGFAPAPIARAWSRISGVDLAPAAARALRRR